MAHTLTLGGAPPSISSGVPEAKTEAPNPGKDTEKTRLSGNLSLKASLFVAFLLATYW